MKCPLDQAVLQITDRQGIEIDYCPTCRGIWLDRGELDKLIERADGASPTRPTSPTRMDREDDQHDDHARTYGGSRKHRKEGLLGELFDF